MRARRRGWTALLLAGMPGCAWWIDAPREEPGGEGADSAPGATGCEDGAFPTPWYRDADGDGHGDPTSVQLACAPPVGAVSSDDDCDDADPLVHPDAEEANCEDSTDYNCDGSGGTDDADDDGAPACRDCDDGDAGQSPDLPERCDGADQDCDGAIDEDAEDALRWFADADADGYGDPSLPTAACSAPAGTVADDSDCDDADGAVSPGATEVCDEIDNDCDGAVNFGHSVPQDHPSISDALSSAPDGAHVCVSAGTWQEQIVVLRSVILEGNAGSAGTIIDADHGGLVVAINSGGAGATLRGFTLRNGSGSPAGLYVDDTDAILDDLVVEGASCEGDYCAGVAASFTGDASLVTNLTIADSTSTAHAGHAGMLGLSASRASFDGLTIEGSTVVLDGDGALVEGGAIHVTTRSDPSFDHVTITGTTIMTDTGVTVPTTVTGGVAYVYESSVTLRHLWIAGTTVDAAAIHGGLLYRTDYQDPSTFENLALVGNDIGSDATTEVHGGILLVEGAAMVSVANASITGNTLDVPSGATVEGGVLGLRAYGQLTLTNTDISHHTGPSTAIGSVLHLTTDEHAFFRFDNVFDVSGGVPYEPSSGPDTSTDLLEVDPAYTAISGDASTWDLQLQSGSGLQDRGDPAILDPDGSRSDVGAHGGPNGSWP